MQGDLQVEKWMLSRAADRVRERKYPECSGLESPIAVYLDLLHTSAPHHPAHYNVELSGHGTDETNALARGGLNARLFGTLFMYVQRAVIVDNLNHAV